MTAAAPVRYRLSLLAALLTLYGGIFALWALGAHPLYFAVLSHLGVYPFEWPFLDTHAVLASVQCHRLGFDILVANPCDALGRTSSYSPLWLDLIPAGITNAPVATVGALLGLAFILSLPFVLRPASRSAWVWSFAAASSSMVSFALERGQADLFIFVLVVVAVLLAGAGPIARAASYAIYLFAGLLKYYPAVLLLSAARERRRGFLLVALASLLAIVVFACHYGHQLTGALAIVPADFGFSDAEETFGAVRLPKVVAMIWRVIGNPYPRLLFLAVSVTLTGLLLILALRLCRRLRRQLPIDWESRDGRFLLIGSILMTGCFFAGESVGYRSINLLLVLPAVLRFRGHPDAQCRQLFRGAATAILFLLWGDGLRQNLSDMLALLGSPTAVTDAVVACFVLGREAVWWWLIRLLAALIFVFLGEAPAFAGLPTPLRRWGAALAPLSRLPVAPRRRLTSRKPRAPTIAGMRLPGGEM